jgi:hypothetical protein
MCRKEEGVEARENREKGGEGGEVVIRIRSLFLLPLLSLYGEMNRHFNDRWLFTALNPPRLGRLEIN